MIRPDVPARRAHFRGITRLFLAVFLLAATGKAWSETIGVPWTGQPGIVESVAQIRARQAASPPSTHSPVRHAHPRMSRQKIPVSGAPAIQNPAPAAIGESPVAPRAAPIIGTNFLAVTRNASNALPPDTMGAVGPSQIFVCLNGRFRLFDRGGNVVQTLDVDSDVFFDSVRNNALTTDPRVRFDRLSGRWIVTMITEAGINRVMIAVSSGPVISDATSFTFFEFQHDFNTAAGDPDHNAFADYDTLGIDANALYIGVSIFTSITGSAQGTTVFVVNKQALLAGTLTVTPFRQISKTGSPGIYTAQGVDNADPNAAEGYFLGVDNIATDKLVLLRVSNPGGTPALSGSINIAIPDTGNGSLGAVPALGSASPIDDNDSRLFQAAMRNGSLYTAHNLEVNASGAAQSGGGRDGARWYEIINTAGTPTLRQSGTLFDASASAPRNYFFPTCAVNGQGHMALGCTAAGTAEHLEVAITGRLAGDPPGNQQPPVTAVTSSTTYNAQSGASTQRWGDYSATVVDPNDNMTFWTFQEYCGMQDVWAVQAIQLKAPPPALPRSCMPPAIPADAANVTITIAGDTRNGAGFYDPDASFPQHLSVTLNGTGVAVNSVTFVDPAHIQINVTSTNASPGARTITVTNPDGQTAVSAAGILCVSPPGPPVAAGLAAAGPVGVAAGAAFPFVVSAVDICGVTVSGYSGIVRFSSSDPAAMLPLPYAYQAADNGTRMFMATLSQVGDVTITATDDVNGFSATFTVNVSSGPILAARPSAAPNPGVAGGPVNFSVTASENPPSALTYAWDFGDGQKGSGPAPSHVFAVAGNYACNVTITDANGGTTAAGLTVVITPAPALDSAPTATPNPAGVGQAVQFNASATEPGGDALSYAWDFGDGAVGQGPAPIHVYMVANTFTATVTVSDTRGGTTSGSVQAVINGPVVGFGNDSDGDGFSDDFETAFGSDPNDPHSTPFKGKPAGVPVPLTLAHLQTRLNFSRDGLDQITMMGSLAVPAGFVAANSTAAIDVSGVPYVFNFDAQGKSSGGFRLPLKTQRGVVLAQIAKFSIQVNHGSFAQILSIAGLTNETVKNKKLTLRVSVLFNDTVFQTDQNQTYRAQKGRYGVSR